MMHFVAQFNHKIRRGYRTHDIHLLQQSKEGGIIDWEERERVGI